MPFNGSFKGPRVHYGDEPGHRALPARGGRAQAPAVRGLVADGREGTSPISPTAVVDANVTLWRAADKRPGGLDFRGSLVHERNGGVRGLPYPFRNMAGSVQFDRTRIRIEEIRGVSHTGATISASGLIEPIGPTASVNLQIDTVNVPVDDVLEGAPETRGRIIDELFDDRRYAARRAGLILTPERAEELRGNATGWRLELAKAERRGGCEDRADPCSSRARRVTSARRCLLTAGRRDLGFGSGARRARSRTGRVISFCPRRGGGGLPASDQGAVVVVESASLLRGSYRPIRGGAAMLTGTAARTPEGARRRSARQRCLADGVCRWGSAPVCDRAAGGGGRGPGRERPQGWLRAGRASG